MNTNPYAPPKAVVADIEPREDSPPLWNPNAAARWSLVFSPAFGAFLHMKNWEALGEPAKASGAKAWLIAVISISIALPLAAMLIPGMSGLEKISSPLGIVLLVSWYSGSARAQMHYVKQRFGQNYRRRRWGKPLLIAVGAMFGYFIVVVTLAAVLAFFGVGIGPAAN